MKANGALVIESLSKKFGDKAEEMFICKAAELGMSITDFNGLAQTNPKLVMASFGAQATTMPKTSSSLNTNVPFGLSFLVRK